MSEEVRYDGEAKEKKEPFHKVLNSYSTIIASILVPVILGVSANLINQSIHEQNIALEILKAKTQTDIKYIDLAIQILKHKPNKDNENLRKWAIELINKHSAIQLDEVTKKVLVEKLPISYPLNGQFSSFGSIKLSGKFSSEPLKNPKVISLDSGLEYIVEVYENEKWNYYDGICATSERILVTAVIPSDKKIRWKVDDKEWVYIKPTR